MNRRKFLLASGTAILLGTTATSLNQRSAVSLEFEMSATPNKDPSSVNSVLIDFSHFELTPHYITDSENLTVNITVGLDGIDSKQIQEDIPVSQNIDKSDIGSSLPLVIDGIDTSQDTIEGEVKITVNHAEIDETYRKSFYINESEINIIDNFEDGNLSEWSNYGTGGGNIVAFSSEGTYALRVDRGGNNGNYLRTWNKPTAGVIDFKFDIAYRDIADFCTFADFDSTSDNGKSAAFDIVHDSNNLQARSSNGDYQIFGNPSDNEYYNFVIRLDLDNDEWISATVNGNTTYINEPFWDSKPGEYLGVRTGDEGSNYSIWVDNIRYKSV